MCTRVIFTALLWEEERRQLAIRQLNDGSKFGRWNTYFKGKLDSTETAWDKHYGHGAVQMYIRNTEKADRG